MNEDIERVKNKYNWWGIVSTIFLVGTIILIILLTLVVDGELTIFLFFFIGVPLIGFIFSICALALHNRYNKLNWLGVTSFVLSFLALLIVVIVAFFLLLYVEVSE
ncbi:MAG: hypothetical protein LUC31_00470 [Coprobacillus sp.]|nr:hypothetical protein [Coprobacillus sp.]